MNLVEWECWFDGDECVRDTRRALDVAPSTAAESFARSHGFTEDGEVDRVRVKRVGSDDETARLIEVRWHIDCFSEDVTP